MSGRLKSTTDPRDKTTSLEYDADGNLTRPQARWG